MYAEGSNLDFTGVRRQYTLSSNQPIDVSFDINDDGIYEMREFFTASISSSAVRVMVIRPNTQVFINDNEGTRT